MRQRAAPSWIRHLHVNGTIYYTLDCRNQSFRRMITSEDVTDLDSRAIIEDCGLEYHQWLEEADIEDLPNDLELVVYFDNPYTKTPIGTFISYEKGVKFTCYPPEDTSVASSSSDDDDLPVVVTVHPKQSFLLASESYPMHYARSHPKQESAFLTALVHSAHEHISGKGDAVGRFNYLEYRRTIDIFLQLKAVSTNLDFTIVANGAITWHIARILHEIDQHHKQREETSKHHVQPFSRPSKVLDGLLCCVFFGVHLIYRERLERVHHARRAPLVDFRRFIEEVLLEWSDVNLLATVFLAANVTALALPGIITFQRTAIVTSTLFSLLGIVIGLYLTWGHRARTNAELDGFHDYFGGKFKTTESGWVYSTYSNTTLRASMLSVPIASLLWSVLCFMMALSAYCLQRVDIGSKIMLGLEIGTFVLVSLFTLFFFPDKLREWDK